MINPDRGFARTLAATLSVAAIVAACSFLTRTFDVVLPVRGVPGLPVSVRDETGFIASVRIPDPAEQGLVPFDFNDGVANIANDQTTLAYMWTGGACDTRVSITFRPAGAGFALIRTTEVSGDVCRLIGIGRTIVLKLNSPVPAARVSIINAP